MYANDADEGHVISYVNHNALHGEPLPREDMAIIPLDPPLILQVCVSDINYTKLSHIKLIKQVMSRSFA